MSIKKLSIICTIIIISLVFLPTENYATPMLNMSNNMSSLYKALSNAKKTVETTTTQSKPTVNTSATENETGTVAVKKEEKENTTVAVKKEEKMPSVLYKVHVQKDGWLKDVSDGREAGTTGKSKRMEAIKIKIKGNNNLGVAYKVHLQTDGWQGWVKDGEKAGTTGDAKRLEAIQIKLTGKDANKYDIYYCMHVKGYGWLNWVANGEKAGTTGIGLQAEAIKIKICKKGDKGPATINDQRAFIQIPKVGYRTKIQKEDWMEYKKNGATSGTTGQAKTLEGIQIEKYDSSIKGSIKYRTHVQKLGWLDWVKDGETSGKSMRIEAIQIKLTGEMEKYCDIYYRAHIQGEGWLGWAKNGESAGSSKLGYRLEAIQIKIVLKGKKVSDKEESAYITTGVYNTSLKGDGYDGTFISSTGIAYKCFRQNSGTYVKTKYWGGNVASHGCGPTSIAVIASGLRPSLNVNPGKACNVIKNKYGNISSDTALLNLMNEWGISGYTKSYPTAEQLKNELKNGKVMMLLVHKENGSIFPSVSGHFVAALDVNNKGQIFIANPNGKKGATTGWYDANTVARGCTEMFITDAKVK